LATNVSSRSMGQILPSGPRPRQSGIRQKIRVGL
jgi:hypothetical protein